ncbi:MAG: diguanylate cyclase [Lachnospiraceae bacterium]|nr:diguanylate cyclase [Lachnospiraceae bacterium]
MRKSKNLTPFYVGSFSVFLVFAIVSIAVFFHYNRLAIQQNAQDTITTSVDREQSHFETVIDLQYKFLEGLASYLGENEELITDESLQLLKDVAGSSSLDMLALFTRSGDAYYSSGSTSNVVDREYFLTCRDEGVNTLSSPIESKVDGETRVVLCVPIFSAEDGETVIGVLGGSYSISSLGDMLSNSLYGGSGQFLIVTQEGSVISRSGQELFGDYELSTGDSLFTLYKSFRSVEITVTEWIEEFGSASTNLIKLNAIEESYYCYYEPLEISDWMLCYIVSVDDAHASYGEFTQNETLLFQVLAAGLLVMVLVIVIVTFRKQRNLVHFAETDALTGVSNKKTTEEYIKLWLADEACFSTQVFIMMDIDLFKKINDRYGHAVGDAVLGAVGEGLREIFRETDIIGRLGGDEFCVFMKNATPEAAVEKADAICQMVRSIQIKGQPDLTVSCSIGVSLFPQHAKNFMDLYKKADKALYISKNSGRDQYTLYDIRTME